MKLFRLTLRLCAALLLTAPISSPAQDSPRDYDSAEHRFRVRIIARGFEHPWSLAFLPDGRLLVTERPGRLRIVEADGRVQPAPVSGVPEVVARGQGGLFDVALHPRFKDNGWIYLAYAESGEGGYGTAVMRAKLSGAALSEQRVIFRMQPKSRTTHHFGGRLLFDRAGSLYLTLGDRGDMERAQRLDDHAGSIIRLRDDGQVPPDNPFAGRKEAKAEKYTLGNRNVQGAALHPRSGAVWIHEHGPQGGDEINIVRSGLNYGWPVVTYGANYVTGTKIGEGTAKPGIAQPLYHWTPSIAPSGMAFYEGERFARWQGDLFVGALKDEMLVRLKLDGERVVREERLLRGELGRIRDVRVGPDGYLYLLTDEDDGVLARLEPV